MSSKDDIEHRRSVDRKLKIAEVVRVTRDLADAYHLTPYYFECAELQSRFEELQDHLLKWEAFEADRKTSEGKGRDE